jgi:hypothetical protein
MQAALWTHGRGRRKENYGAIFVCTVEAMVADAMANWTQRTGLVLPFGYLVFVNGAPRTETRHQLVLVGGRRRKQPPVNRADLMLELSQSCLYRVGVFAHLQVFL